VVFGLLFHNAVPHKGSAIPRGASGKFCCRNVVVGEDQMQNLFSHEHAKSTWLTMRVRVGEICLTRTTRVTIGRRSAPESRSGRANRASRWISRVRLSSVAAFSIWTYWDQTHRRR
jgi:hypothetical protein